MSTFYKKLYLKKEKINSDCWKLFVIKKTPNKQTFKSDFENWIWISNGAIVINLVFFFLFFLFKLTWEIVTEIFWQSDKSNFSLAMKLFFRSKTQLRKARSIREWFSVYDSLSDECWLGTGALLFNFNYSWLDGNNSKHHLRKLPHNDGQSIVTTVTSML